MKRVEIKEGDRYGMLRIVKEIEKTGVYRTFRVLCDCGNQNNVFLASLRSGGTKSCGCLIKESQANVKHGHNSRKNGASKTYYVWAAMIQRCSNKNNKSYKNYGGRGIKVSKSWLNFENFLHDMGEKPEGLVIDRINNEKGYSKNNCRWTTVSINNKNRRPFSEWKSKYNLPEWEEKKVENYQY